jgi:TetR/AcrR family transcriptional regulator
MASTRRMGVENSEIRAQLIDAAEQIIREEGSTALTARRLAEKVDLKRQIVHYYFGTIDDVYHAVMRRSAERTRARLKEALASDEPLQVMSREGHVETTTSLEFIARATRDERTRAEIKSHIEEFRGLLALALTKELEQRGLKPTISPTVVTIVMMSISEALALESVFGVTDGHAETKALLEEWLQAYVTRGELLGHRSHDESPKQVVRELPRKAKSASRLSGKRRATTRS